MATIDPAILACSSPDDRTIKVEDGKDAMDESGFTAFSAAQLEMEDDIDEDSKLLFSEEGKKLSSKERRQLRNKVSARNFRVRRKGMHHLRSSSTSLLTDRIHQPLGKAGRHT
jgi:hypothetical protein